MHTAHIMASSFLLCLSADIHQSSSLNVVILTSFYSRSGMLSFQRVARNLLDRDLRHRVDLNVQRWSLRADFDLIETHVATNDRRDRATLAR